MIEIGRTLEEIETVNETNVAAAVGSGGLAVYATPAMIALMEKAAWRAVEPCLEAGSTTVGTEINVRHIAASPIGAKIRAVAVVTAVDRKKISFSVEAFDESGKIGEGTHARFIVRSDEFLAKAEARPRIGR